MKKYLNISRWWKKCLKEKNTIKIFGVGCGGINVINHLSKFGKSGFALVACDMDKTKLLYSNASTKLQLGIGGLGAGNNPEKAQIEAEKKIEVIRSLLGNNTDIVFIVVCFGGGCGTGVAPVIARESRKLGIKTIGVATIPFEFEGKKKFRQAIDGVSELTKNSDAVFLLNNQYLIRHHRGLSISEALEKVDNLMFKMIKKLVNSL